MVRFSFTAKKAALVEGLKVVYLLVLASRELEELVFLNY